MTEVYQNALIRFAADHEDCAALAGPQVQTLISMQELEAVREEWTALLAASARASLFMTWEWQAAWWRHYGKQQSLRVLMVRSNGLLIGLQPLYIQDQTLLRGLPLRVLRPVGTGGDTAPDYLEPLYRRGYEQLAAQALANAILNNLPGWHIARISDLSADSPFIEAVAKHGMLCTTAIRVGDGPKITLATLPPTWDEFLAGFNRDRRWSIRHARRRFMKEPGARFVLCDDPATLDQAIDRLIELHNMRWNGRAQEHAFSSAAYVNFHREAMHGMLARGALRLYALELGGSAVAMLYCFRHGQGLYYFQGGFDPGCSKLSPGAVLFGLAIESAINEGCTVFDMLRGQYEYKNQWGNGWNQMRQVEMLRPGLATSVFRLRHELAPRLRRKLQDLVGA
jgi:CelD/BcsL family acetyltransferase involved in cellulose biosynthesis